MKKTQIIAAAILTVSFATATHKAQAAAQTLDGIISDAMCSKKHMMPGKSAAECISACVQSGSSYVLVVGDKTYSLDAKAATIAPFAGKHVQIQGEVKQTSITVSTIHEAKASSHAGMKM